jgi:beta-phosphoglucomutase-like phosphatase (HAD superfamily)
VRPLLILFDIDRTLVDVGPLHDLAYDRILRSFGGRIRRRAWGTC